MHWHTYFPDTPLSYPPSFDARIVLYPGIREVRDYFSWRQADTHINNLYNTVFWALIHKEGQSPKQAHEALHGTVSSQKQEMLFSRFGINYNALPSRFRKGTVVVREQLSGGDEIENTGELSLVHVPRANPLESLSLNHSVVGSESDIGSPPPRRNGKRKTRKQESSRIALIHCDIIENGFWEHRPYLLEEYY